MACFSKSFLKCCPSSCLLFPWLQTDNEEETSEEEASQPPTPPPEEPMKPPKVRGVSLHMGTDNGLGYIAFTLRYDVRREILKVHMCYARDLVAMDPRGTSDPYVIVGFNPIRYRGVVYKTRVVMKTLKPKWYETFVFKNFPNEDLKTHILHLIVNDWDKGGDDDPIGELEFPLRKLYKRIPGQKRRPASVATADDDSQSRWTFDSARDENSIAPGSVNGTIRQNGGSVDPRGSIPEEQLSLAPSQVQSQAARQSRSSQYLPDIGPSKYDSVSMISKLSKFSGVSSLRSRRNFDTLSNTTRGTEFAETPAQPSDLASETFGRSASQELHLDMKSVNGTRPGSRADSDHPINYETGSVLTRMTAQESTIISSVAGDSLLDAEEEVERPFVIRRLEIKKFLKPPPNSRYTFGEMLLGIGYYPKHGVLIIRVVKGRHMRDPEGYTINPFVSITLRRLLEKQEKTLQTVRTSVRSHVDQPVWNEQFEFRVQPKHLKQTAVDLKIHSVASHATLLGQLRIASKSYPTQREHFQAMLDNIGQVTERWHLIRQ